MNTTSLITLVWTDNHTENYYVSTAPMAPLGKKWIKYRDFFIQNNFSLTMVCNEWVLRFTVKLRGPDHVAISKKRDELIRLVI